MVGWLVPTQAFAVGILDSHRKRVCAGCLAQSAGRLGVYCSGCGVAYYCSARCRVRDLPTHAITCPVLAGLTSVKGGHVIKSTTFLLAEIMARREFPHAYAHARARAIAEAATAAGAGAAGLHAGHPAAPASTPAPTPTPTPTPTPAAAASHSTDAGPQPHARAAGQHFPTVGGGAVAAAFTAAERGRVGVLDWLEARERRARGAVLADPAAAQRVDGLQAESAGTASAVAGLEARTKRLLLRVAALWQVGASVEGGGGGDDDGGQRLPPTGIPQPSQRGE